MGLIPGQGTKIPHAIFWGKKKKKNKQKKQPLCIFIIVVTWFAYDQNHQSFPLQFILFVSVSLSLRLLRYFFIPIQMLQSLVSQT